MLIERAVLINEYRTGISGTTHWHAHITILLLTYFDHAIPINQFDAERDVSFLLL